ncbi:MAG: hypothetical protein HYY04_18015 [Chloroflexi bacterium]|nr:hypothetical protein [Chloroflexota bacterium]
MNSRERVRLAFNHQEPDRVPVTEVAFNARPASEILGRPTVIGISGAVRKLHNEMLIAGRIHELYEQQARDTLELYRKLEYDILPISPVLVDPPVPEPVAKNTWRIHNHTTNRWTINEVVPDGDMYQELDSSLARGGLEELERVVEDLERRKISADAWTFRWVEWARAEAPEMALLLGGGDLPFPGASSWVQVFYEAMVVRPDLVERYFDAVLAETLVVLEEGLKRGVDLVWGGVDLCYHSGPLFSPAHYVRYFQPRYRRIVDLCHRYGVPYIKHNDGNILRIEREFLLDSGFDAWHPIEPTAGMELAYFKRKFGDRITLLGNVDCGATLTLGSEEEVVAETRERISQGAPGGGYVLTSGNSIHSFVPARNVLAMRAAAHQYGVYPIPADTSLP